MRTIHRKGEDRRVPMSLRISPAMRDRLVITAQQSGRSLTQEIELRLEQSFGSANFLRGILELAYGPAATALLLLIGRRIRSAAAAVNLQASEDLWMRNAPVEDSWIDSPDAFQYFRSSIQVILDWLEPDGDPHPNTAAFGKSHTVRAMRDITGEPKTLPGDPPSWLAEAQQGLGLERLQRGKSRPQSRRAPQAGEPR